MNILISTNMYQACEFEKVFEITDSFHGSGLGVEIFPMFHEECYEPLIEKYLNKMKEIPISFHGPYYHSEHSAKKGSKEYEETMGYVNKTLLWAEKLNCRYFVFHHNNKTVTPENKKEMLSTATENLKELLPLCAAFGIPVAIENAGVKSHANMLLDEGEFVSVCKELRMPVLIDIGHAHANGWNLRSVMEELQEQIISYHVHNNDGYHDGHCRIFDGTLDMKQFLRDFEELTPNADFVLEYCMEISGDTEGIKEDVRYILNRFPL